MMNESIKGEGMERGIDLSLLDTSEMSEKLQMQLAPFHAAYKPHGEIVSRAVLRVEGEGSYFQSERAMDMVARQASMLDKMYYRFIETVNRDEEGEVADLVEDE